MTSARTTIPALMMAVELLALGTMPVLMMAVVLLALGTIPVLLQEAMEIVAMSMVLTGPIELKQIPIQRLWKLDVAVR